MKPNQTTVTTHSPLPWTVNIHRPHGIIKVESKDSVVCDTINNEANASLIVRAVNNHQALVDALKEMQRAAHHCALQLGVDFATHWKSANDQCNKVLASLQ